MRADLLADFVSFCCPPLTPDIAFRGDDIRLPIAIMRLRKTCGQMSRRGDRNSPIQLTLVSLLTNQSSQVGREETDEKTSHYNCSFDAGTVDRHKPCEREPSGIGREDADQKCVLRHGKVAEKSGVLECSIRMSRQRTCGGRSGGGPPTGQEYSR